MGRRLISENYRRRTDTPIAWSRDSKALLYIRNQGGVSNIWRQPIDGGESKQITNFQRDKIFFFDLSPDGKRLALARGTEVSDVVLIKSTQ